MWREEKKGFSQTVARASVQLSSSLAGAEESAAWGLGRYGRGDAKGVEGHAWKAPQLHRGHKMGGGHREDAASGSGPLIARDGAQATQYLIELPRLMCVRASCVCPCVDGETDVSRM